MDVLTNAWTKQRYQNDSQRNILQIKILTLKKYRKHALLESQPTV